MAVHRTMLAALVATACGGPPAPPPSTAPPPPTTTAPTDAGLDAMTIAGFAAYFAARSDELCPEPSPDTEEEEGTCGLVVDDAAASSGGRRAVVYASESIYEVTVYLALQREGAWTSIGLDAPIDAMTARERRATVYYEDVAPGAGAEIVVALDWDEGTEPEQPVHHAMIFACSAREPGGALGCAAR